MKRSLFIPVIILVILSSCTQLIFVEKTYDPEITPARKPATVAFVNIFDYTSPAYVKEKNSGTYHAGVRSLAEGLSSISGDSFRFIIIDTLNKYVPFGMLTALLPEDTILAVCKRGNADLLLTLDSLNLFFDWETVVDEDESGKSRTKNFYLYARSYLSLYSDSGDLINRSMVEKSTFYKSRIALSGLITFQPSLARAWETVSSLAFEAGQDYVSKFYPRTVQESRTLYGGKAFKESNAAARVRDWDKATSLLEELKRTGSFDIALKAEHNLSVIKEASGVVKE